MTKELANVGNVNTEALAAVLANVETHPGGYDVVQVCVYTDGSGEIQATVGDVSAPITFEITFEYPWQPEPPEMTTEKIQMTEVTITQSGGFTPFYMVQEGSGAALKTLYTSPDFILAPGALLTKLWCWRHGYGWPNAAQMNGAQPLRRDRHA
jgi:hypothetical protein